MYTVTDKADGDRKLLFINNKGKIYLITTNMNIQFTGAETKNKDLYESILDGEHILYNKKGQFINLYAAFDIYFINNKDVRSLGFTPLTIEDIQTNFRFGAKMTHYRTFSFHGLNGQRNPQKIGSPQTKVHFFSQYIALV